MVPLTIASLTSIGHFLATSQAAPVMLSLRHTPDDEAILTAKLDKFERWSAVRTTLQVLTFFVLMWALIVGIDRRTLISRGDSCSFLQEQN